MLLPVTIRPLPLLQGPTSAWRVVLWVITAPHGMFWAAAGLLDTTVIAETTSPDVAKRASERRGHRMYCLPSWRPPSRRRRSWTSQGDRFSR